MGDIGNFVKQGSYRERVLRYQNTKLNSAKYTFLIILAPFANPRNFLAAKLIWFTVYRPTESLAMDMWVLDVTVTAIWLSLYQGQSFQIHLIFWIIYKMGVSTCLGINEG